MSTGRAIVLGSCAVVLCSPGQKIAAGEHSNVRFVHSLIGTAPATTPNALSHGTATENRAQVIPEVTMPFGMTNWTPQTRTGEAKCIAPYYYDDTVISGFRGTHWLSGSCTQDYGSVTIMPISGILRCQANARASHFSHARETSTPYSYKVVLDDYGIESEITSTTRCGFCRFAFSGPDTPSIVIEPNSDYGEGEVRIFPDRQEIVGRNPVHRIYQGWGEPAGFSGYFVARFSEPIVAFGTYRNSTVHSGETEIRGGTGIGGFVRFLPKGKRIIVVKVGTSFTSVQEARNNLMKEAEGLDFDSAEARLKEQWNAMLARVNVEGGTDAQRIVFYTAMYHTFLVPRVYNDCDGSYPKFAGGDSLCSAGIGNYYCDFSLWDTYRALHPLYNLLIPDINADMVRSLLSMARQGGWLPIFPCWNSYTSAMIGDHAVSVIADAVVKGTITLSDEQYDDVKKNATQVPEDRRVYLDGKGVRGLESYMHFGYIPLEDSVKESFHKGEQVSRTLEYAYDDFALSQIAKSMGKTEDYQVFLSRSRNYRNVYDSALQCVCGRFANGSFTTEFSRTERMPYITEGTPWQYTWYVPQDVDGLITMMGGSNVFNRNLDEFFASGQYWHGNEPDQQVPFLYDYSGQPGKTQAIVSRILTDEYADTPGGLSGNDDAGQISAWYVFASMGLYPVCPSMDEYALTAPSFKKIVIRLPKGKILAIEATGVSSEKAYAGAVHFNGKPVHGWRIRHSELMNGGTLRFSMQSSPPQDEKR